MTTTFSRRDLLRASGLAAAGLVAVGGGSSLLSACGGGGGGGEGGPIKVGVVTDLTGAIGYAGKANANIAKMVVDELNSAGGLLGRQVQLVVVDSASDPKVGVTKARELVEQENVDVVLGGITSAMRDAIKSVIVDRGGKLYIYPQLYEGLECNKDIFCTGPTPNQQVDPFIPWLIENGGKKFYLPSADYVWPHTLNQVVREQVVKNGGTVVDEEYFPLDATDFGPTVNKIMSSGTDVVFTTVIPPGISPFLGQLYSAGFHQRGGRLACVYFDENLLNVAPPEHMEGLASCLDYFEGIDDPFSRDLAAKYQQQFPGGDARLAAGSAVTGMYRGLMMWAGAVQEAGSLDNDKVRTALSHAKLDEGPGGPAEMVEGENHVRMNMYIAVAKSGTYEIVEQLGAIDPEECLDGLK